ncbi:hypothetical protein BCR35DRAFT_309023 [Leucosporidium creatinivorum]|uniref:DASH complex subunit DAD2 n=1 Tax=Leucosporidium creatinivorum TaxID=106004 RepID=A0A1Y2DS22_9BASI|nr:hypothetical protein BCR35DRAFT_309023 [Leucosporidium creatinivorum]
MSYSRPSTYSQGYTPAQQRLVDKQREYQAFLKIHQQGQDLLQFFHQFGDKYDVLDGGSEAVGDAVEHWKTVFRATHLALNSLATKKIPTSAEDLTPVLPPGTLPDRLVRIPVEQEEGTEGGAEQGEQ